jgi:hypothetical protein
MRHYREHGGSDSDIDSDKENAADTAEQDPHARQGQSALTSARSGMTGLTLGDNMSMLNTARSVFRELQYPQQAVYEKCERIIKAKSKGQESGLVDVAEALSCAVNDEYAELARMWGVGCPGQENRPEDRLAICLKRVAKRAEKACMEALAQRKVTMPPSKTSSDEMKALDDECAELEAQIAATDRRVATLREALDGGSSSAVQLDPQNIVKDLLDRLSRNPGSDIVPPRVVEFENMMNDSVQGLIQRLIAAGSSCQQLPNRQKEILEQRNAALCAAAASGQSGLDVLRRFT